MRLPGKRYRYIFAEHLNYLTPGTMKRFTGAELEIVELKSMHFNPLVILKDFRGGEREIPRAERQIHVRAAVSQHVDAIPVSKHKQRRPFHFERLLAAVLDFVDCTHVVTRHGMPRELVLAR